MGDIYTSAGLFLRVLFQELIEFILTLTPHMSAFQYCRSL